MGSVAINAPITGPDRSVMMDAVTTNAAATAMRSAITRMKRRSGDIFFLFVVPANAGTQPLLFVWCEKSANSATKRREAATYGSRGSPGRRRTASSHPLHGHRNLRTIPDGLIDHAITLGEFQQKIELVLRRRGIDVEAQANFGEAHRRFLVDAERTAKIEISFGSHDTGFQRHLDRGRDRFQRDTGAGDERFQEHV